MYLRKDIITCNMRAKDGWVTYVNMLLILENSSGSFLKRAKANPLCISPVSH